MLLLHLPVVFSTGSGMSVSTEEPLYHLASRKRGLCSPASNAWITRKYAQSESLSPQACTCGLCGRLHANVISALPLIMALGMLLMVLPGLLYRPGTTAACIIAAKTQEPM